MRDTRVLITGATGFLGKNLGDMLRDAGYSIVALVRENIKLDGLFSLVYPNLVDLEESEYIKLCSKYEVSAVIHCAAISKEKITLPWKVYEKVNVMWPYKLCRVCKKLGIRFIFISSVGVYGTAPRCCPAQESHPYMPDGKYHKSKMLAEQFILSEMADGYSGKNMFILRLNALYGNGDNGVLMKLWKLYKLGILVCNFKAMTSFCSVDLVFEVVKKILEENVSGPLICNVSEPGLTFESLVGLFSKICEGEAINMQFISEGYRLFRFLPWLYNKYALLCASRGYEISRVSSLLRRELHPMERIDNYVNYYANFILDGK